jgi:hypothetical protein
MFGVDPNGVLRLLSTGLSISDIIAIAASVVSSNILGDGQCRLSVLNTTTLKLSPFAGSSLIINGVYQALPTAGITLQLTGPNPTTQYFIYAYMNGSTMTLEGSTTGYTLDAFGRANKTGDTTRRLIGWAYTNSASQFQNDPTWRGLSNFFNRQSILIDGGVNTSQTLPYNTTTPVTAPIDPTIPFYVWASDRVEIFAHATTTTSASSVYASVYLDGVAMGYFDNTIVPVSQNFLSNTTNIGGYAFLLPSEGLHTTQGVMSGTGAGGSGTLAINYSRHYGYIRG